jgi:uncharacterized protein YifN (PemK superfamily)
MGDGNMRFSDIYVKHIYNVIFDPVRDCEFDGRHLALVLKRNNDGKTLIVMPLTSESNGVGLNKIKLDSISSLPSSLRNNFTYAVYNQIRTVNADRFIALKEGNNRIQSRIDNKVFNQLLSLGINEIIFNLCQDEKIDLLKKTYETECINKAKDLAYNIKKLDDKIKEYTNTINRIREEIKDTLKNIEYTLEQKYIDDGIKDILDEILKNN